MRNNQKKKIVITGSCGSLGRILKKGLDCYNLSFIDLNENGLKKCFKVDITKELTKVTNIFKNNDIGIHLAWNMKEDFPKEIVNQKNKQMAENIFKATVKAKVKRLIIASSVHANDYSHLQIKNYDIEYPYPDSPYGASKVYIESLGKYYAKKYNLEIIFIRLGGVNKEDIPLFNEDPNYDRVLLYKKDFVEMIKKCIEVTVVPNNYQIFTAVSNNKNKVHQINNFLQWKPKLPPKKRLIDTIVIPVGGESKRLRDYLKSIKFDSTKTLIPINGIPLLKYIIDNTIVVGYKKIYLLASYYVDDIEKFVNKYYHDKNVYVVNGGREGRKNGINTVLALIKDELNQPFVYCDGDMLVNKSLLKKLRYSTIDKKTLIQCIVSPNDFAQTHIKFIVEKNKLAEVTLDNKEGKQEQKYCSLGLMTINSNIFKKWPAYCRKEDLDYVIKEMFDQDRNNINYEIYEGDWISIHYKKDVLRLKRGEYNFLI